MMFSQTHSLLLHHHLHLHLHLHHLSPASGHRPPLLRLRITRVRCSYGEGKPQTKRSYPFDEIEPKWQKYWEEKKTFRAQEEVDTSKPKFYILDMFPYPRSRMRDTAETQFKRVASGDSKPNSWTLLDFGGGNGDDKEDTLKRNYPILAQLPMDMRPVLAPSNHKKVSPSVRQDIEVTFQKVEQEERLRLKCEAARHSPEYVVVDGQSSDNLKPSKIGVDKVQSGSTSIRTATYPICLSGQDLVQSGCAEPCSEPTNAAVSG